MPRLSQKLFEEARTSLQHDSMKSSIAVDNDFDLCSPEAPEDPKTRATHVHVSLNFEALPMRNIQALNSES